MKKFACAILIFAIAAATARGAILTEPSVKAIGRGLIHPELDAHLNDMMRPLKEKVADLGVTLTENCPGTPAPSAFNICKKEGVDGENSVQIIVTAPGYNIELSFSNIDLQDQQSEIQVKPFIDEIIEALPTLILKSEDEDEALRNGVASKSAEFERIGVKNAKVERDNVVFTFLDKQHTVAISRKDNTITLSADNHVQTITSENHSKDSLKNELGEAIFDFIQAEIGSMQLLDSEMDPGNKSGGSLKTLQCQDVLENENFGEAINARVAPSGLSAHRDGKTFVISKDLYKITITCEEKNESSFDLIVYTVDYTGSGANIPSLTQAFPKSSLYNLNVVAKDLVQDAAQTAIMMFGAPGAARLAR